MGPWRKSNPGLVPLLATASSSQAGVQDAVCPRSSWPRALALVANVQGSWQALAVPWLWVSGASQPQACALAGQCSAPARGLPQSRR
eukprot:9481903-Pyramimonas_sp.AAC.1